MNGTIACTACRYKHSDIASPGLMIDITMETKQKQHDSIMMSN